MVFKKIDEILLKISEEYNLRRILDVGAGNCEISLFFSNKGTDVDVIDIDPKKECESDDISIIGRDIRECEVPEKKYDLVILRGVVHYFDPETLFKKILPKIKKSVRDNGLVYIFTMTPPADSGRYTHRPEDISTVMEGFKLLETREVERGSDRSWYLLYQKRTNF